MKHVGMLLLVVGVAVSAMFGARLSPEMRAQMVAKGRAQLLGGTIEGAHEAYCASFEGGTRPPVALLDGCEAEAPAETEGDEAAPRAVDVDAVCAGRNAPEQTESELVAAGHAALEPHYSRDPSVLSADQQRLRTAWLALADEGIEPAAAAAVIRPIPPQSRLTGWFADSGLFFLLGLALVVVGAVIGRIAHRREAAGQGASDDDAPEARDLGEMLEELKGQLASLSDRAAGTETPKETDFDELKAAIHDAQLESFEPIVASAPRVQAKYGMGPFAEIFGPLSASERHVNRAWSALVDRHWPEASSSLARAVTDLAAAREALDAAMKEQA